MDFKLKDDKDCVSEYNTDTRGDSSENVNRKSDLESDIDGFYIEEPYYATNQIKPESASEHEHELEPERTTSVKSFIKDLLFYAVLIFICVYIIPNFVLQRTIVDGVSMENNLSDGDHLYVEKISYRMDLLDRFDIIVFYPYGRDNEEYYVKRIIGLPGETIQIQDSKIYIDGEMLDEDFGNEPILDPGRAADPILLGKDEFFVMGDNRNISKDSRYSVVGNVQKKNIGGKAFFRVSPLKEFGPID